MKLGQWVIAGLFLSAVVVSLPFPARAHSFLVDTRPGQGERLERSPAELVFQFTEAVVPALVDVSVTGNRAAVAIGPAQLESEGRVVRIPILEPVDGVTVVSWHVTSEVDGHESAGELAFAVGDAGALPAATTNQPARGDTWWRWLFLGGLSLGAGSLVASMTGQLSTARWVVLSRLGLTAAAISPAVVYITTGPGPLTVATVGLGAAALFLATAALTSAEARRLPTLVLVGVGVLAWSARSHTATIRGVLGMLADAAHLAGAALWFGTLGLLAVTLWRTRHSGEPVLDRARKYSRWALRAVIVLAAAGLASALTVLTGLADLWATGYGRLLSLKILLFSVALGLATTGRWRALRQDRAGMLRRLVTIEVVLVAAIMATSGLLAGTAPPALATTGDALLGPPRLQGPVARVAGLAGNMTIGVHAGDRRLDLLVYNSSTGGIEDARLEATATLPDGTGLDLHPRPCGAGCFTQHLDLPEGITTLSVTVHSDQWTGGTADLTLHWPPPAQQEELLEQVITTMRAVEELTLVETVTSGPGAEATTTATLSGDTFIDLEVYAEGDIDEVSVLPGGDGIRLYLPGSRILIDLHLDSQNRILRERIVSPGHEITRDFTYP